MVPTCEAPESAHDILCHQSLLCVVQYFLGSSHAWLDDKGTGEPCCRLACVASQQFVSIVLDLLGSK